MNLTAPIETRPLSGHKILIPRGGPWGDSVAAGLRIKGATVVIAPMINFIATDESDVLDQALKDLADGAFDWVTMTSATTVDVLSAHGARIPESTRVAAVGETTAAALAAAGYKADLVPSEENTAQGLLDEWHTATGGTIPLRVLTLRSELAVPVLTEGLIRIGHDVTSIVAYRTVGVQVADNIIQDVRDGIFSAIVVTSGSVAEQVSLQFGTISASTFVAALGPRTAKDAASFDVRVDEIVDGSNNEALIELLTARVPSTSR